MAVDLPGDPDGVVFVYDADGRRVSRSHGDRSTVYVGGVFEIDRDGSTVTDTRTHYRFGDTMVATRTHSPASVVFLLQDHLGSTTAGFDDTSNTAMFQWYFPYGAERHAVGSLPTEQRYTGQTSDATGAASGDTGLLFYNARYYDPDVGAFVAADPIVPTMARSVGLNRYAYVADNPMRYTDPTGHCWDPTISPHCSPENAPQVRVPSTVPEGEPSFWDFVGMSDWVQGAGDIFKAEPALVEYLTYTRSDGGIRWRPNSGWQRQVRNTVLGPTAKDALARSTGVVVAGRVFGGLATVLDWRENRAQYAAYENLTTAQKETAAFVNTAFDWGGGFATGGKAAAFAASKCTWAGPACGIATAGAFAGGFFVGSNAANWVWDKTLGRIGR